MAVECCEFTGAEVGATVVKITIVAGSPNDVTGIIVTTDPCAGYSDTYSDTYDVCAEGGRMQAGEFTVATLPADRTLIVDGHERTVRVFETGTDNVVAGLDALSFIDLFDWVDAAGGCCARICVDADTATVNADTTVTVEVFDREL